MLLKGFHYRDLVSKRVAKVHPVTRLRKVYVNLTKSDCPKIDSSIRYCLS